VTSLRPLYWLTASFGLAGFVSYFLAHGIQPAFGFLLGAAGSFGNLWLYDWLSRAIAPGAATRKPWQAGAFIARYLVLFTIGYAIVKGLGVNPLTLVLGLLVSAAAILVLLLIEIVRNFAGKPNTH